ncbi:plastid division protein CDP1, chloroplastic [Iris pallida]|uniref:Plastid division protein CDP1, chloroplastic n=1 Tax=Iris pallida TaxID=29817 RepID=A0AAX6HCQ9_IRIPA|nr:plastid division protein CDP1, chloroplastic [Iris pallida]
MALAHPVTSLPPCWRRLGNGVLGERRRAPAMVLTVAGKLAGGGGIAEAAVRVGPRGVGGSAKIEQRTGSVLEIPVTCFQILGVPEKAEKDEIVKAAMELKNLEIEDGYTADLIVSRQDLLMDVRDKLLFEQEYAGSVKEKVPPKSSLHIPCAWLPAALCILQEVGEMKLVLEIGRASLRLPEVKPYIHDLLLSMALAECSIAKTSFEKNKVSDGFEALARAQYLLRSKVSLEKMPLLSQENIEESLEELAPACTLDLLGLPHTPDNAERKRGAIAALRELLRQGLDVETTSRVQDWHCFLNQALKKLTATEIVDIISWDALAIARKNKKSLESQNQRVIVDFDCFYMALIAHIALGFSTRQINLISKAKTICECLIASDGMDLKFEQAFCSLLLGQVGEMEAVEKLRQLDINGTSSLRSFGSIVPVKDIKEKCSSSQLLETWLKDAVLCVFPDTQDCSPSLANFFGGPKRNLRASKQNLGTLKPIPSVTHQSPSIGLFPRLRTSGEQSRIDSSEHLGEAVKQLALPNLQGQLAVGKAIGSTGDPQLQLRRNLGLHHAKLWESWCFSGDLAGRVSCAVLVGCLIFSTFKLLALQFGYPSKVSNRLQSSYPKSNISSPTWSMNCSPGSQRNNVFNNTVVGQLRKLLAVIRLNHNHQTSEVSAQDAWPSDSLSSPTTTSAIAGSLLKRTQMPQEEAEALVKQWQDIKSEALGPDHQIQALPEILTESMLLKWQDLANLAKTRSCFWRFVLLQLSILRADIVLDEVGSEIAEIEAILEEAAELVDESKPRKPSYYSTYKVQYVLKRHNDGSWKFCRGGIQSP